jgi:drug/metabolite transporter (DMT)-like permease
LIENHVAANGLFSLRPDAMSMDQESARLAAKPVVATAPNSFAHPILQLALSILLSAAAQVLLKLGAPPTGQEGWLGLAGMWSAWTWLGIVALIGSLLSWLYALRFVALSVAFTLAGAIHALIPLGSWLVLGESISSRRWLGILLVIVGVVISAKPATAVEEKL